jgi:hypothetical protein
MFPFHTHLSGLILSPSTQLVCSYVALPRLVPACSASGLNWMCVRAFADCVGGCFETGQSYFGAMDEIRLWRVERNQQQILQLMHQTGPMANTSPFLSAVACIHFRCSFHGSHFRDSLVPRSGRSSERSLVDVLQRSDFESRRKALHGPEMRLSRRFCQVLIHLNLLENRRL